MISKENNQDLNQNKHSRRQEDNTFTEFLPFVRQKVVSFKY